MQISDILAPFSRFFSYFLPESLPPTRFNTCSEFKEVVPWIQALRLKEKALKIAADKNGTSSLDFRKYEIVKKLVANLDAKIGNFNLQIPGDSENKNKKQCMDLVTELRKCINEIGGDYYKTLQAQRNNYKEVMNDTANIGIHVLFLLIASYLPLATVVAIFSILFVSPKVSKSVRTNTGLNSKLSETVFILQSLSSALLKLGANLGLSSYLQKEQHGPEMLHAFICPLSLVVMNDPVECELDPDSDRVSYQREALTKWLLENHCSPRDHDIEMTPEQIIGDVLKPNVSLKQAIDEFRKQNPQLFEDEFHDSRFKMGYH